MSAFLLAALGVDATIFAASYAQANQYALAVCSNALGLCDQHAALGLVAAFLSGIYVIQR